MGIRERLRILIAGYFVYKAQQCLENAKVIICYYDSDSIAYQWVDIFIGYAEGFKDLAYAFYGEKE